MSAFNPISFMEARKKYYQKSHDFIAACHGFVHHYPPECVNKSQKRAYRREAQEEGYQAFYYNYLRQNGLLQPDYPFNLWQQQYGKICWREENERRRMEIMEKKARKEAESRERMAHVNVDKQAKSRLPVLVIQRKPAPAPQSTAATKQTIDTFMANRIMCSHNSEAFKARYNETYNQFVQVSGCLNGSIFPATPTLEIVNGDIVELNNRDNLLKAKTFLSQLLNTYKDLFNRLGGVIEDLH